MATATRLRALLWDVDGTLADTEGEGHLPAFREAFAEAGLALDWDGERYRELLALVPGGRERILHELRHRRPPPQVPVEALAERLHAAKKRLYAERVRAGRVPLRPGVRRLIAEAEAAGVRQAIVTTSARPGVEALLETALGAGERGCFEVLVTAEDVATKKPHPDAYALALRRLGLAPRAALALEDSATGLRAALAAGLTTVVTTNAWTAGQGFAGAAWVVPGLDDDGTGRPVTVERLAALLGEAPG